MVSQGTDRLIAGLLLYHRAGLGFCFLGEGDVVHYSVFDSLRIFCLHTTVTLGSRPPTPGEGLGYWG